MSELLVSELTSNYDNSDATSYVTASVSPATSALLYVPYATRHATTAPAATVSGGALSWFEIEPEQVDGITTIGGWVAQCGATPGTFAITLTMDGAVTAIGCSWHVIQVTGHHVGGGDIPQAPNATTGLTGTTATVTFAALANPNNVQILHAIHRSNEAQAAEAGWIAGNLTRFGGTPNHSSAVTWRIGSADLSATQTWSTSSRWQAQGLEVAVNVAPTVSATEAIVHLGTDFRSNTGTTSLASGYPDGYVAVNNDLALLHVTQTGSNSAVTTPAGYTLILRTQRAAFHVDHLYRRKLVVADAVPTVVAAATSGLALSLSIMRGVDTATAEDATAVSNTGTDLTTHTGPDIGALTTPCAAIMSFTSADNAGSGFGIIFDEDAQTDHGSVLSPFKILEGQPGYSAGGGGGATTAAKSIVYHHQIIPNQTQLIRTHSFVGNQFDLAAAGWITTTIALRPATPTTCPVPRDMRAAVRQQTLRTWGALCSTSDTVFSVRLSVQVFNPFDGGGGVWSSGTDGNFWDVEQWAGPGRWQDITSLCRGLDWTVGADQPAGRPRVGTATIELDNESGALSPWATTGTYTNNGRSWLRTGILMRIATTSTNNGATTTYSLNSFTGIIEDIVESAEQAADSWITITLVQPISILATHNGIEQIEQGGGEDLYARVNRLLGDAEWPYGFVRGNVPAFSEAATLIGTVMAGERLTELYLTADSAGVDIFSATDGGLLIDNPTTGVSTRTFSNLPTGSELPFASAQPYANNQRLLTTVIGARVDGQEIEVMDGEAVSRFGRIDTGNGWPRRDLICQSDATVAAIVNDVLAFRATDDSGVAAIVVDADMQPGGALSLYTHLSFMQIYNNTNIEFHHPTDSTLSFTQTSYTEGMHHQVTKLGHQMKWICTISLARFPD